MNGFELLKMAAEQNGVSTSGDAAAIAKALSTKFASLEVGAKDPVPLDECVRNASKMFELTPNPDNPAEALITWTESETAMDEPEEEDAEAKTAATTTIPTRKSAPAPVAGVVDSQRIKAAVEREIKALGIKRDKNGKAIMPGDAKVTKSAEHRKWDAIRHATGDDFFSSYENAKAFALRLAIPIAYKSGDRNRLTRHLEMFEKITGKNYNELYTENGVSYEYAESAGKSGVAQKYTTADDALLDPKYDADMIRNIDEFGTARSISRVSPMSSKVLRRPKQTGILPVQYIAENAAGTPVTNTMSETTLTAQEGMILIQLSRAVVADAEIDLISDQAREIARGIAYVEDNTWWNGDGTSAGFIPETAAGDSNGWATEFGAYSGVDVRHVQASGNTRTAITHEDLTALMGRVAKFARPGAVWVCTAAFDADVFQRLASTVGGGVSMVEIGGTQVPSYLGHPIMHLETAADEGASTMVCMFGDPKLSCSIGDRMSVEIATDESAGFTSNSIYMRGIVRHDFNIHSPGGTTDPAPKRNTMAGLYLAA